LWPAMLLAFGCNEDELPQNFLINGFLISDGEKMSKSRGNVIDPLTVHENYNTLLDGRGVEVLRYVLMREFAFGTDGDITPEKIADRYTHQLVNGLGNTTRRIVSMTHKYGVTLEKERYQRLADTIRQAHTEKMQVHEFQTAVEYLWNCLEEIDRGIETVKPWELKKTGDWETLTKELSKWAVTLEVIAEALYPIMPESSELLRKQLAGEQIMLFPKIESLEP
ncbi:MAG: class I tRNA ligase family protein, partial [Candidatus Paceibacteria bacterium]